jgi:hypothetical protein
MIIYHQNNVAAFKGNHVFYTPYYHYASWRFTKTSAVAGVTIISQARAVMRFTFARVFGRVN